MKTEALTIRRAHPDDAPAVAAWMADPAVFAQLMQMPYPSVEMWRERLAGTQRGTFTPEGRKRATRAAPDCALARMPWRCLYHCGTAPRLRRHFLPGCLYSGGGVGSGSDALPAVLSLPSSEEPMDDHSLSNDEEASLTVLCTVCSTLRAASSNCDFIFLSSSSSIERLTSARTSAT